MTELVLPTSPDRSERTAAAQARADRSKYGLHQLLSSRPELRGVHAPADFAADSIRWSV